MSKTKNKTQAERAITFAGALGGLTEAQTNTMLAEAGFPAVSSSSWEMLLKRYVPAFRVEPRIMGECIAKPLSVADLAKRVERAAAERTGKK